LADPSALGSSGQVLVCPTSHLDWDWLDTFAQYFQIGPPQAGPYAGPVSLVLTGVYDLLNTQPTFAFCLAETGYLQAFVAANPGSVTLLASVPDRFVLLGGGITSPDNLVCHGEVFIRNYLVGRQWLASVGLAANVSPVAWLPDDFGHDPQLPVTLAAMGLQWAGISRVPGSPQPFANQPLDKNLSSVAQQLESGGVVFPWVASDGSVVLTHYLPATYGEIWDGSKTAADLQEFVENSAPLWPTVNGERTLLATAGGDFAVSEWTAGGPGNWVRFVQDYNDVNPGTDPAAVIGTFPEFMAMVADSGSAGAAQSPLQAQNYWTGIFASRPRLKILHYRAAQLVLAAEAAATQLRVTSTYSTTVLDDLDAAIDRAWQTLVPSSHHDYLTGTSPDRTYWSEQLPLLELAARQAEQCLTGAVELIAAGVAVGSGSGTSVVVFNPLGFTRGGAVCLPASAVPGGVAKVSIGGTDNAVQRAADGGLMFSVADTNPVDSFGYLTVTLEPGPDPSPAPLPGPSDVVTLQNGLVTATIERGQAWAITSLAVGGAQLLPAGKLGNSIRVYSDTGNIYQFGNEPLAQPDPTKPPVTGTFADTDTTLTGDAGEWVEAGPIRWHFRATVTGSYQDQPCSYALDYLLYAGETVLRMRLTGAALPSTSVVTAFGLDAPLDAAGYGLTYGTPSHYDDHVPVRYWDGPTFRATHDFAQVTGTSGPGLAIYHQSVPAWSVTDDWQLLGALLRNNPGVYGEQRGAAGTDPGVHTLEYAVGAADASPVTTGDALRTALTVTNPLVCAVAGPNRPTDGISLPLQAGLAGITSTGGGAVSLTAGSAGILRAARTQGGSSVVPLSLYYAERFSFILRVYLPDPASCQHGVTITLPSIPNPPDISGYDPDLTAVVVSALEEPVSNGPAVTVARGPVSGETVSYTASFVPVRALTTIQVTATRWPTQPTNGMDIGQPPAPRLDSR
jgi:alpha-mannosidase